MVLLLSQVIEYRLSFRQSRAISVNKNDYRDIFLVNFSVFNKWSLIYDHTNQLRWINKY